MDPSPGRLERLDGWLARRAALLCVIVAVAVVVLLGARIARHAEAPRGDTRFYREGARRFWAGEGLYYQAPRPRPPGYAPTTGYTYLPPFAALSVWMLALPYVVVRGVWLVVCVGCAGLALREALRLEARGPPGEPGMSFVALALTIVLAFRFGWNDLAHGQVNWIVALLLAVVLRRRAGGAAGIALGVALVIKPTAWPLVPFFLLLGRWRLVLAAGLSAGGLLLVTLLRYGAGAGDLLRDWVGLMRGFAFDSAVSTGNASLTGLGTRLLAGSQARAGEALAPLWLQLPREQATDIARAATLVVGVALFALLVRRGRRDAGPVAAVGVVVLSALVSPVTWKAHLVVVIFPLLLLLPALLRDPRRGRCACAGVVGLLLVLPSRALLDLGLLERLGSLTLVLVLLLVGLLRLGAEPDPAPVSEGA